MTQTDLDLVTRGKLSVRQDIINVILSRGELSKDDFQLIWSLSGQEEIGLQPNLANEKPGRIPGSSPFAARRTERRTSA